ncbi:MAG TPA: iron donor protein CyaY [Burkholderiales bacterium]|nr:iron donor protein CyaY [Pseudomonadota bacterium]HVC48540.1 iron donor protein CyaY [Burkholderiales bacterium]
MTETEFNNQVDLILENIVEAIDSTGIDIDYELAAGMLTLTFENESKIVINRQAAMQELWVAARAGGFHYRLEEGIWKETRSDSSLSQRLSKLISEQSAIPLIICLDA